MPIKKLLRPERIRKIEGSFSWIDHRLITGGFLPDLSTLEILLYLFLIAVSDRNGLSFYHDDRIASLLKIDLVSLGKARAGLFQKSLLAYEQRPGPRIPAQYHPGQPQETSHRSTPGLPFFQNKSRPHPLYLDRKSIMKTLCKNAKVRYFRLHALRHLGASILDRENVNLGAIQRLLGHENRTTTEIYLHSIGEAEREAMKVFEKAG
jgi:hypothetical protein